MNGDTAGDRSGDSASDMAGDIASEGEQARPPGQQIASLSNRLARRGPRSRPRDDRAESTSARGTREPSADRQASGLVPGVGSGASRKTQQTGGNSRTSGTSGGGEPDESGSTRNDDRETPLRNVGFSLLVPTKESLRKVAKETETTQAEVVYRALEKYAAAGLKAETPDVVHGSLFERSQSIAVKGPRSVHTLRMPSRNIEVIDELVQRTGHPNRSSLVQDALDRYLGLRRGEG